MANGDVSSVSHSVAYVPGDEVDSVGMDGTVVAKFGSVLAVVLLSEAKGVVIRCVDVPSGLY